MIINSFLKSSWILLTKEFTRKELDFLNELVKNYSSKERYYHNLSHVETLLKLTNKYKHLLSSLKTIQFAIWYHDAIYDASKNDNEERSAELARKRLTKMGVNEAIVKDCCNLILSTKSHKLTHEEKSFDAKFFLDIDLSILATPKSEYLNYSKQIRQEYKMYSDELYLQGRKKVLSNFLNTERIYKTDLFYDSFEKKARKNLAFEISLI